MGTWGIGFSQNDVGNEVSHYYINMLKLGKKDDEALRCVLENNSEYLSDSDDMIDFWLSLGSTMLEYGRMTDDVKEKVLYIIVNSNDSARWVGEQAIERRKLIDEFKKRIIIGNLEYKEVKKLKPRLPKVFPNEVYIYKLVANDYENTLFYGKYLLLLVDEWIIDDCRIKGLGDKSPLIYLKISDVIPCDEASVDKLPFFSMLHRSHYYYGGNKKIDEGKKILLQDEKRIQMNSDGFSKIKNEINLWGVFDFERDVNAIGLYRNKTWDKERYDPIEGYWKGQSCSWKMLNRDLAICFDSIAKYGFDE